MRMFSGTNLTTSLVLFLALSFSSNGNTQESQTSTSASIAANGEGSLILVANGEDFVRQGFLTKDNWQVNFDRVAVNVGNVVAYQAEPGFDPDENESVESQEMVTMVEEVKTVDLAEGPENAEPVVLTEVDVNAGSYNALSWEMIQADDSGFQNQTIVLQGKAVKDNETVDFNLGFALPIKYVCGEFVGEQRKGIVQPDSKAEVEMTFHFDHVFGDAETSLEDSLNQGALGFQPLANLSESGVLTADWQTLQQSLAPEEVETLTKAIVGLGHVGEGHCKAEYKL